MVKDELLKFYDAKKLISNKQNKFLSKARGAAALRLIVSTTAIGLIPCRGMSYFHFFTLIKSGLGFTI